MSEEPIDPSALANPDTQEDYGWDHVAQEMHTWHPGLQEHARRHLEQRGLLQLVASTGSEGNLHPDTNKHDQPLEQAQDGIGISQVHRLIRPTIDSMVSAPRETKIISDPEGVPVHDALTDEMKKVSTEEFILGHSIDVDSMAHVDEIADKLYEFCATVMGEENSLRKYALATIIARGLGNANLEENNIYLLMQAPAMAEEKGHKPADYFSWTNIFGGLGAEAGVDPESREIDNFVEKLEAEASTSIDPEGVVAEKLYKELIEDLDEEPNFPESELGSAFKYRYDSTEKDTLDMLTVLELDEGNKYYKRLLLRVFSEASQDEKSIDVVEYYEAAAAIVQQKISEGVIPSAFGEKLLLYQPKEFVFEDKMTAILNGKGHWAGYYGSRVGMFAIIEDYQELLPTTEELEAPIEFREPGTEGQYDENSDEKLKTAIHELFHHLSGHSFVEVGDEIKNRKVGLSTDSWGRAVNEAVTERLASLVFPEADQVYNEERAFLHALQINSGGLITDELLYDAYLEEREEGGLPKLKKLIQTIGETYGQKGFMQRTDKVFEDEGYQAAIDYLRKATEARGRVFRDVADIRLSQADS